MKRFSAAFLWMLTITFTPGCTGQTRQPGLSNNGNSEVVGGPFENGDFLYIGMPKTIHAVDTSTGFTQAGQKLLITGTIFKPDGKTPAPGVILYYYHTDVNGYYANRQDLDQRVKRHGYIRGWVKSDAGGHYSIYTVRPAPYPNADIPAHIHPAIKEPGIDKEYYIDEFVFDDDKLLTTKQRNGLENRGGSGVLRVIQKGDLQIAEHNIIPGLNIPNYPRSKKNEIQSGLQIGEDNPSFTPFHAWGPDKGTRTCPVCKYGRYHGIVYFVGNHPNWPQIKKWLSFLEQQSITRKKYLKAYFVYGNKNGYDKQQRENELAQIGMELNLHQIALTFVPSLTDRQSEADLNKINPEVENTIVIYKNRSIVDKYIDLPPSLENFALISGVLDKTRGVYFHLPEPRHD